MHNIILFLGMCGMVVSQTNANTVDSFHLQKSDGTATTANSDTNCDREFISVPSSQVSSYRYCGTFLSSVNLDTVEGVIPCKFIHCG